MNKFAKKTKKTREYIADSLIGTMDDLAVFAVDNPNDSKKIMKQIDTLRLLIANIYPEEYEHYLYEDYAFGLDVDLNNRRSNNDI